MKHPQRLLWQALLLLTATLQLSWQISPPTATTYEAGVVEFPPAQQGTPKQKVKDNLARMKAIIESQDTNGLDILVFPEFVLNSEAWRTYVPDPALRIAPCDVPDYDYFLTELSCAVRSRQLYVVFNMMEKEYCAETPERACDESGFNTFNTNVVLDRQGRVISRYRKTHLYRYEWNTVNVLAQPELATFTTDFGVTFGHFICFDMLFWEPAQRLLKELNVTDIIYPTYWFSELPFMAAVQLQESWAFANDVNLLAANANNPIGQNSGSGIYAGKMGRLVAATYQVNTTKLLKATVPKHQNITELPIAVLPPFVSQLETPRFTQLQLLRDYNVDIFKTLLLPENFTSAQEALCHGTFCCSFTARRNLVTESSTHSAYRFRLAAYSGAQTTHQRVDSSALSVCAIFACTNAELYSCGHIFPEGVAVGNKYYFNELNVSGTFPLAPRRLLMPSTVDAQMMPLPVQTYEWSETKGSNASIVSISLTYPKLDLLTFGIWGNYYSTAVSKHNLDPIIVRPQRNAAESWLRHALPALLLLAPLTLLLSI